MNLLQLPNLLAAAPNRLLAFGGDEILVSQWLARVGSWQESLAQHVNVNRAALFVHDRAEFSAALIALWLSGKEAWLAPNNLAETTRQLSAEVDAFIGDFPSLGGQGVCLDACLDADKPSQQRIVGAEVERSAVLVLFTSGSSGQPQKVHKQVHQLAAEVEQLEKTFGTKIQDTKVLATVSHQHIYGLLFSVLWPLSYGRPFARQTTEYVEELFSDSAQRIALVSSPTHLSRLSTQLPNTSCFAMVFSSGAPLADTASKHAHEKFNADIVEVFGSTETGGIAWRVQHRGGVEWQLFEAVEAKSNSQQQLIIRSAFLPNGDWFETSDLVSFSGSRFSLIGRADRIVKVEGKRVSLAQVEEFLLREEWIDDVRVEPIKRSAGVADRDELMAIVVLSVSGKVQLKKLGRLALATHFKTALSQLLERPLIPRRWRYVESLPRNSQGKLVSKEFQVMLNGLQSIGGVCR